MAKNTDTNPSMCRSFISSSYMPYIAMSLIVLGIIFLIIGILSMLLWAIHVFDVGYISIGIGLLIVGIILQIFASMCKGKGK